MQILWLCVQKLLAIDQSSEFGSVVLCCVCFVSILGRLVKQVKLCEEQFEVLVATQRHYLQLLFIPPI